MSAKTELNIEAERASFEAATSYAPEQYDFDSATGGYELDWMQHIWMGWLAARRATIRPTAAPSDEAVANAVRAFVNAGKRGCDMFGAISAALTEAALCAPVAPADAVRDARDLALEEAAKAAEAAASYWKNYDYKQAAKAVAVDIRLLKTNPKDHS